MIKIFGHITTTAKAVAYSIMITIILTVIRIP